MYPVNEAMEAPREASPEDMAKYRAESEERERRHRIQYKTNTLLQLIADHGTSEDAGRALDLLRPIALDVLGR